MLLPALLLTLACDKLSLGMHDYPIYAHVALGARTFIGNLFFLQKIHGMPVYGSDAPLWSIACEAWYYLLFPLAFFAWKGTGTGKRLMMAGAAIGISFWIGSTVMLLFVPWLLGVLLNVVPTPSLSRVVKLATAGTFVCAFLAMRFSLHGVLLIFVSDLVMSAATLALLWSLLGSRDAASDNTATWLARSTAGYSYTLYAVHAPFLLLLASLLHAGHWLPYAPAAILNGLSVLIITVAFCWLISRLTEVRTEWVRSLITTYASRLRKKRLLLAPA